MNARFIISVDLGGTNLKIALLDLDYNIRYKKLLDTKTFVKKEDLILAIIDSIEDVLEKKQIRKTHILGVGLGLPGPIDVKEGIVHFFPNIPGWKEVNLKKILKMSLKLPIFLDNDANLMCLAEHKLGAAKGLKNVVCLTLGTGVGGGIIIEGKLYRGSTFAAGEIGHVSINEKGPKCNCGGIACLEAYIGNIRIIKEAKKIFKRGISLEELGSLAKKQNKRALNIWIKVGKRLGIALSGVVNLLNLDAIIIGGGIANVGNVLLDRVRDTIRRRAMSVQARHIRVLKAKSGNDAGLIGAAILVKEGGRL